MINLTKNKKFKKLDSIDLAEKVCGLINDLIELIVLFKDRDSYLESVSEFLNSIGETIKNYESSPSLLKKKIKAFEGLKNSLDDFLSYLKEQKKKNCITKFFTGNKFITSCDEHISDLQKWIGGLQLDLHLYYGQENIKNFEHLCECPGARSTEN